MLEVKNLVKTYSTKGGVIVKALDDVSVKFPEKGMVFLLGRSGSGKSTLLNVSGGLDKPGSGEIIVKGRSSKDFSEADFDSYRNTYVGFIFQEYNILNEFTVEQNIALALQLQNKPNDKVAVENLLKQVDLEGFGKRKPNTLSGGQKQRVAIARALIKEPEIIMADEPTGALDSNTGKQVLDTLKKLSENKLVIVVSHDREFAEFYGDRIIELKDGKILSDVSKTLVKPTDASGNVQLISEDTIRIKNTEDITEQDIKNIVSVLKKNKGEAIFTASKKELSDVKRACKINDNGSKETFEDTKEVKIKEHDGKNTKFIKSRLPMSHAFKMGASGLKTKPIRLIFTVILSIVAFLMFGVVSTFSFYNASYSVSEGLKEANYPSITISKYYTVISKNYKKDLDTGEEKLEYESEYTYNALFGASEINSKNNGTSDYAGIFTFSLDRWNSTTSIGMILINGNNQIVPNLEEKDKLYYPVTNVYGFSDAGEGYMQRNGFVSMGLGRYPSNPTEIAIPEYVANLFVTSKDSGFQTATDLIGKKMKFSGCQALSRVEFTIVGIYDVGDIPTKYDEIKDGSSTALSEKQKEELSIGLGDYLTCSFNSIIYVSNDFYDEYKANASYNSGIYVNGQYSEGIYMTNYRIEDEVNAENYATSLYTTEIVERYSDYFKFYDLNDNEISGNINKDQVFITKSGYISLKMNAVLPYAFELINDLYKYDAEAVQEIGKEGDDTPLRNALMGNYSEDSIEIITSSLNKWYLKLSKRKYVYESAMKMINYSSQINDGKYATQENHAIIGMVNNFINESEGDLPIASDWKTLEDMVYGTNNGFYSYCKQSYYAQFLNQILKNISFEDQELLKNEFSIRHQWYGEENCGVYEIQQLLNENQLPEAEAQKAFDVIERWYKNTTGNNFTTQGPSFEIIVQMEDEIFYKNYLNKTGVLEIVGYYVLDAEGYGEYLVHTDFIAENVKPMNNTMEFEWREEQVTNYVAPSDAKYNHLITLTDNSQANIANALQETETSAFKIENGIYKQMEMFLDTIKELKTIFLIIGAVVGVFAGLMLLNFISVSISSKRKDIGILRAVGARGTDVFKIFFSEAFIIATICFILASIGAGVVCNVINGSMVTLVNMKLLNFNVINVALVFLVSFGVSLIATFFPVYFASKKSPVESIRAL